MSEDESRPNTDRKQKVKVNVVEAIIAGIKNMLLGRPEAEEKTEAEEVVLKIEDLSMQLKVPNRSIKNQVKGLMEQKRETIKATTSAQTSKNVEEVNEVAEVAIEVEIAEDVAAEAAADITNGKVQEMATPTKKLSNSTKNK